MDNKKAEEEVKETELLEEKLETATEMLGLREIVKATSSYKTDFMYSVLLKEKETDVLPIYIEEGLKWLME